MRAKLKGEGEYAITWICAHSIALIAEAIAINMAFKSYNRDHSLIYAVVLPLMGIMPWIGAMAAIKRYKQIDQPAIEKTVRRDISCELGGVVLSAYLLFIFAFVIIK